MESETRSEAGKDNPRTGIETPSNLITSYHYLRYILLGILLYISGKFIDLCGPQCPCDTTNGVIAKILLAALYTVISLTLLAADMRNYMLYKLLLHKYYEVEPEERKNLASNLDILENMLRYRKIDSKMRNSILGPIQALNHELKKYPHKYSKKLILNYRMFWAVQPGPVSLWIMFTYFLCIAVLSVCGLVLWH